MEFITNAHMVFLANVRRPQAFLSIFDRPGGKARGRGRPTDNEKELLRATVVFAVAALDAYLHDVVLEEVPRRGVYNEEMADAFRSIAREDPTLALRVALADNKASRQREFREALDGWLSLKSFHGPEAVIRALGYLGHRTTVAALEPNIGAQWARRLTEWTQMRHGMVHRAETPYIRRTDADNCVHLVMKIVEATDAIVVGTKV
jgi:hypothetical protein